MLRTAFRPLLPPRWFSTVSVVLAAVAWLFARTAAAQDLPELVLPGTQPGELTQDLRGPEVCASCHADYAEHAAVDTWQGTMMANAARDPLFHAALTVANQDIEGSGDLCIRCHSPRAWLFGRSSPPLISGFEPEDFDSVSCDFCHRLVPSPEGELLVGTGQYFVADDFVRRGPIEDALSSHESEYAPYFSESALCAICHDVSNPLQGGFAIERTYTEWLSSDYSESGISCQDCHMPAVTGKACGARLMPDREVHRHELAGGNTWMPLVLAAEHPELGREASFQATSAAARKMLQRSARLTLQAPPRADPGERVRFTVRVENLTGHKLPTGYPEGRRCWLRVQVIDDQGRHLLHSGAYDEEEALRADDPDLRTYEVRMAADGVEGFHFILQNELLQDNRIPPRGFRPRADTAPVGRDYPVLADGTLAHWDEAPYEITIPEDASGRLEIRVALLYQTTSREYVEELEAENVTDDAGERMLRLWNEHGRAPPEIMASALDVLEIGPADVPGEGGAGGADSAGGTAGDAGDAGDTGDAGAAGADAGEGAGGGRGGAHPGVGGVSGSATMGPAVAVRGGCSAAASGSGAGLWKLVVLLLMTYRVRRHARAASLRGPSTMRGEFGGS